MELHRYEDVNQYIDFLRDLSTANFGDRLTFNGETITYVSDEIIEDDFVFGNEYKVIKVTYIKNYGLKTSETEFRLIIIPSFILKENNRNEYKVTNNNEE